MDNIDLYRKRMKGSGNYGINRLEENKVTTFKRALDKSYNSETVKLIGRDNYFQALISGISTKPQIEQKEFSVLKEQNCDVGDVIYWVRDDSYWIISHSDSTERSIFQATIQKAIFELSWKDPESNKIYKSMACAKGQEETTISGGVKHSIFFDEFTDSLYLIVPAKAEGSELLRRYFEIMVNGRKWHIEVANDITNPKLIFLHLKERSKDRDNDSDELVGGNNLHNFKIVSSLDELKEVERGTSIDLKPSIFRDNQWIRDKNYTITGENCLVNEDEVVFNSLGDTKIIIRFTELEEVKIYNITVVENETEEVLVKRIVGSKTIRTMTTSEFKLEHSINGESIETNGEWIIDDKYFDLLEVNKSSNEVVLKAKNKTGTTKVKYEFENIGTEEEKNKEYVELNVKVIPLFSRS